jgi:hypothetical protein
MSAGQHSPVRQKEFRSFVCDAVDVIAVSDGLVARKDTYLDLIALERQIGPLPRMTTTAVAAGD